MLLLTGQRTSNVLSMEWSEIDWCEKAWQIPPTKTKTGRTYFVNLVPGAMDILERRSQHKTSLYVFPAARGGTQSPHMTTLLHGWNRIRERAGLHHLVPHSLRHTLGTWMAMQGASAFQIQKALNHANVTTSQIYTHLSGADIRPLMTSAYNDVVAPSSMLIETQAPRMVHVEPYTRKDGSVRAGYSYEAQTERRRVQQGKE